MKLQAIIKKLKTMDQLLINKQEKIGKYLFEKNIRNNIVNSNTMKRFVWRNIIKNKKAKTIKKEK